MPQISILWPQGTPVGQLDFSGAAGDLNLGALGALLFSGKNAAEALSYAQGLLSTDMDTLTLRQDCISDLLRVPALIDTLEQASALIDEIALTSAGVRENIDGMAGAGTMNGLKDALGKLERLFGSHSNLIEESDLDNYYGQLFRATVFSYRLAKAYTGLFTLLSSALTEDACRSEALRRLRDWVGEICEKDRIPENHEALEKLSGGWDGISAFTVDMLLDETQHVIGLELLGVQSQPYEKAGVLTHRGSEAFDGLAKLSAISQGGGTARFQECLMTELGSALRAPLLKLRNSVCQVPISAVGDLLRLGEELPLYISASRFALRLMDRGAAVCCPTRSESCFLDAKDAYPVDALLIHGRASVGNDLILPMGGTVNFITGANSSGKTTCLVTAGQLLWLYHLGCHLPCREAAMSPTDGVHTLFASGESDDSSDSRMGLEARKLASFRGKLTGKSVILMNEPMTSTSAGEGVALCTDLLQELIRGGISGIMVTHYNEIYGILRGRLQEDGLEDRLISYVMETGRADGRITYPYRLLRRDPGRSSHAGEIAASMGVTLRDMLSSLSARGIPMHPEDEAWKALHPGEEDAL